MTKDEVKLVNRALEQVEDDLSRLLDGLYAAREQYKTAVKAIVDYRDGISGKIVANQKSVGLI